MELEQLPSGVGLTEVPQSIIDFYQKILTEKDASNQTLNKQLVHDDWVLRPNIISPLEKGPGLNGLKQIAGFFAKLIPDFKAENKARILHEDKVIVLSKISGTVAGALPCSEE